MRLAHIRRLAVGSVWVVAAATVALLPGLGPLLDHHYAGRQPGHDHVHMGALFSDHLHDHEVSHDHNHDHAERSSTQDEEDRGGPVVIASHSGAVLGHAYVSGSASQTELWAPDADGSPHSYYSGQDGALRQQNTVAPPTEPPRV